MLKAPGLLAPLDETSEPAFHCDQTHKLVSLAGVLSKLFPERTEDAGMAGVLSGHLPPANGLHCLHIGHLAAPAMSSSGLVAASHRHSQQDADGGHLPGIKARQPRNPG